MNPTILIGFPRMAAYLGVQLPRLLEHRNELEALRVVECHWERGALRNVAAPGKLREFWQERTSTNGA